MFTNNHILAENTTVEHTGLSDGHPAQGGSLYIKEADKTVKEFMVVWGGYYLIQVFLRNIDAGNDVTQQLPLTMLYVSCDESIWPLSGGRKVTHKVLSMNLIIYFIISQMFSSRHP